MHGGAGPMGLLFTRPQDARRVGVAGRRASSQPVAQGRRPPQTSQRLRAGGLKMHRRADIMKLLLTRPQGAQY